MRQWLDLWDYRRRVAGIYDRIREMDDPAEAWAWWRRQRDELFAGHPQSPFDEESRQSFVGLPFFPYDARWRMEGNIEPLEEDPAPLHHSGPGHTRFRTFGQVGLDSPEGRIELVLLWLDTYGGGVFLPFRDATNGSQTYGGGRYLLDTAKGADLGHRGDSVVLDFNFSYHPSCVHDPRWSCPLAPPENRLEVAIRAGEELGPADPS